MNNTEPRPEDRILSALRTIRVAAKPQENEIHDAVDTALSRAGIEHVHEYRLKPGCRVDFACGKTGIEIKKGRPKSDTLRTQLTRYLEDTDLDSIIVVTQLPCALPAAIAGKPVYVVSLNRNWGVALG